jgi:uncharacterized membrane protein YebE (DUF533 family)
MMSLANILEGLMKDGLSPATRNRLQTGASNAGADVERTLESLLGADRMAQARDFMTKEQSTGMSGGRAGGLGALLGGLLGAGGGVGGMAGGAMKGGALAMLGTLAWNAYQQYQAQDAGRPASAAAVPPPPPDAAQAMSAPDTEKLVLRAMLMAAKADGKVDQSEADKILARAGADGSDAEDRAFLDAEMAKPVDPKALAAEVSRPEVAMEVYLAALMAIELDSEAERSFLRDLAAGLGLAPAATARLHAMTGAPAL